jgi:hypothetical protein
MFKCRVSPAESQEKNEHKLRIYLNLRRKLSWLDFCRGRQPYAREYLHARTVSLLEIEEITDSL